MFSPPGFDLDLKCEMVIGPAQPAIVACGAPGLQKLRYNLEDRCSLFPALGTLKPLIVLSSTFPA